MTATAVEFPPPPTADDPRPAARPREWAPIIVATVIFAALSLWAAIASQGFLEADSCTHYQYARFALTETHYLVNVWGRPFVTALYAVPAVLGGRIGVRVTSLCCALAIAALTSVIARNQKYRWPALAFIFVLAQPLVYLHSFSELTELPFALLLTIAFLAYQRRQWLLMAVFVALLPTARPEGFGFLALAAAALVLHRRPWWLLVLPIPLLIWDYAGWRVYGCPIYTDPLSLHLPERMRWLMWLRHEWPYAEKSTYASGYLLHFVALMPAVVAPLLWPFTCVGAGWSLARPVRRFFADHVGRVQMLIALIPLMILGGHSLLYWLGRMASNGELRYMLVVAPFWALLSAKGFEWCAAKFNVTRVYRFAAVASLATIAANLYYPVLPLHLTVDGARAQAVADWYRTDDVHTSYPRLLASNPEIAYFLGVSHTDPAHMRDWRKDVVAAVPPGTLLVWDPVYALFNADNNRVVTIDEIERAGWIERPDYAQPINDIGGDSNEWRIFVSPSPVKAAAPPSFPRPE